MGLREELLRHLGLGTFVVVDLETTGLDPEKDQIIEIGAIKFVDGKETETLEQLINPGRSIPEFITRLTGISDQDVEGKPSIDEIFPQLERFIGDAAFVGQQVNFDASFLEYHFRKRNNDFQFWEDTVRRFKYLSNLRIDTLFIARIFMPFLAKFKLGELAKYFGYNLENAHRAVEDARATGHIFLELVERALAIDNSALADIINLLYPNSRRAKNFFVPVLQFKKMKNIQSTSTGLIDDIKNAQQFYNVIGNLKREPYALIDDADIVPVHEQEIDNYFTDEGALAQLIENYELRPQQQEMAHHVAEAFNNESFLIAEAGTGVGKSMAYLIPAVEYAERNRKSGKRVIISTNTKNLQEQLFFKDIPTVFSANGAKFTAALLKGRANYICLEKWHTIMTDMNQRISQDERSRILPLVLWVRETRTGDIAENAAFQLERNFGLWRKLIAEPSYCPGRACKYYTDCFLMKAREQARKADIVIVNHSLLFSDLVSENSILDRYDLLVMDEAHNIEKSAAEYLGIRVSFWDFRNAYHKLYEEEPKRSGILQQLELRLSRGRLGEEEQKTITRQIHFTKRSSQQIKESVQIFYNELSRQLRARYMPRGADSSEENRVRYFKGFKYFKNLFDEIEKIQSSLEGIIKNLSRLIDYLSDLEEDSFEFQDQLLRELIALGTDFHDLKENFAFCIHAEKDDFVYWLDISRNERNNDIILHGVPLNIAHLLKKNLFDKLKTGVFTSATLAVNKSFDYFAERTGLNLLEKRQVSSVQLGSPFDFENQLILGVLDFMPDPRNADYTTALADIIKSIHQSQHTGMLVLFTSYGMLNRVYGDLKAHFDAERILLLAQGKSGSRTNLINQFRENRDSVLFGTDSFWEGVDVPGEALELLFIPKLPFDVPSDPLIAARMDEIKKRGGNPFFEYSVPEAIIKFRQGFGRLIRSKTDRGVVLVGDNRLSRMQYGKQFLNSLPVKGEIFLSQDDLFSALEKWYKGRRHNE